MTDVKQKECLDNKKNGARRDRLQQKEVTRRMEPGEIGEQQWKGRAGDNTPDAGRGEEVARKGSQAGWRWEHDTDVEKYVVEQRWKGRETRTRETHQRLKRIADGEKSQVTPSGYGLAHW